MTLFKRSPALVVDVRRLRRSRRRRTMLVWVAVWCADILLVAGTVRFLLAGMSFLAATWGLGAFLVTLGIAASVLLGRRLAAVVVHGASMEPTYHDGDRVLVRRGLQLGVGQVVVVEQPEIGADWTSPALSATAGGTAVASGRWMIKRVAAVAGDPVPRDQVRALADVRESRVPPGELVLLGDNADVSYDSRRIGYFPADRVLGVVVRSLSSSS
jgi:signal peptidase I